MILIWGSNNTNLGGVKLKKIILKMAMLIALGINSLAVAAADNTGTTYAGVQYAITSYNEAGFDELNPTALIGRFGKNINDGFALEGRLGFGLQDDNLNYLGVDVSLELDNLFGVYGVGHVNLSESSSLYGLIGVTQAELSVTASAFGFSASKSESDSGLSLGVGANIGISNNAALNVEYMQYLSKSDYDLNAISFGVVFKF